MYTLFIIHSINIILNYALIFGKFGFPELGVSGAALATMLSLAAGTAIYSTIAFSKIRPMGFFTTFPKQVFSGLFNLSISNAIQSFLYALSYNVIYKVIAELGTNELAAAGIVINFALVFYLPGLAFGLVATSLVSQEIGKKDFEAANNWCKDISKVSSVILGIASIPLILFPEFLLSIFIKEKEAVIVAIDAVRILGISIFIEAQALTMMHALLGAGDSKKVMYISTLLLWLLYIPLSWFLGIYFDLGLNGIWTANLLVQISMALIYTALWKSGKWKEIKI